jgi:hypothetical protein
MPTQQNLLREVAKYCLELYINSFGKFGKREDSQINGTWVLFALIIKKAIFFSVPITEG